MSDTASVANKLVELCRAQKNHEAMTTLYSPDIVSVESASAPSMPTEMRGMDAVLGKATWWVENNEVHSASVTGPFMGDNDQFAVRFEYDTTFKPTGKRAMMNEMALYTVKDGKIVHEHFYYNPGTF